MNLMIAYHEITPDSLESVSTKGLKRSPRGEKGDKDAIKRTDAILDAHRPEHLLNAGISRANNNYAYLVAAGGIIDITDGKIIKEEDFIANSSKAVLQLTIDANRCYLSDLDAYDKLKVAVEHSQPSDKIHKLIDTYWSNVIPISSIKGAPERRVEIMIPYDIPPSAITVVKRQ